MLDVNRLPSGLPVFETFILYFQQTWSPLSPMPIRLQQCNEV